ncbi:MAG TPA: hypothetical protein DCE78_03375 [Bacteroidetes bacterium]|nr:hypothetical protein [Bacteroidota bacterium]
MLRNPWLRAAVGFGVVTQDLITEFWFLRAGIRDGFTRSDWWLVLPCTLATVVGVGEGEVGEGMAGLD